MDARPTTIYWGTGEHALIFDLKTFGKAPSRVIIRANSRKSLARVLIKFRIARRSLGTASTSNLAGLYKQGSLRWIACHSGCVIDIDRRKLVKFKNPNLRKIINFLQTI